MFAEKPLSCPGSVNGGFMVFERRAIEQYIPADRDVMLEREPFNALADDGELMAYKHDAFWYPVDSPRERDLLEDLWQAEKAPWIPSDNRYLE